MSKVVFARRYAEAVFEIAHQNNELDRWLTDLGKIAQLTRDTEMLSWLENPKVPFTQKSGILKKNLGPEVSPLALNLVYIMITKNIIRYAGAIAREYRALVDENRGIATAGVTTAAPLGETEKADLIARLSSVTGKKIELETRIDPAIIGGFVARVGDKLLDGSTKSKLTALKQKMAGSV